MRVSATIRPTRFWLPHSRLLLLLSIHLLTSTELKPTNPPNKQVNEFYDIPLQLRLHRPKFKHITVDYIYYDIPFSHLECERSLFINTI